MSVEISEVDQYNFVEVESYWRNVFFEKYSVEEPKVSSKKYYVLEMFPYPSGKIHMGHVRNYTIGDILARFYRLKAFSVLHPIGWDAFGLPAENAALDRKIHPKTWTYKNISDMREQLKLFSFSYNWSREFATCDEDYYRYQQKIFGKLYKSGFLYRKKSQVNWDPVDNCVLANEQVIDGRGWRSGAEIEKKFLDQWFFKITDLADELLDELDHLDGWPEKVRIMQKNWIGKSEGAEIVFNCVNASESILVFSTRPETIFGATYVAISPNSDLALKLSQNNSKIKAYLNEQKKKSVSISVIDKQDKTGIDTGLKVKHPFLDKELPVFIANFVLYDYGTGAIFATPAHDERDFEFASKYKLPIIEVIESNETLPYTKDGILKNSRFLDGLNLKEAKEKIILEIENRKIGARKKYYKLRDWGISRQRYWGCPIPIVHCEACGDVLVEDVLLPEDVEFLSSGNPLEQHKTWKYTKCPKCGKEACRETDTLDTFVDSSWYFLRFSTPKSEEELFNLNNISHWLPVDQYIGGVEHAILHLLYARFFTKALKKCGLIENSEPFKTLLTQGMVCNASYKSQDGRWLFPEEVMITNDGVYIEIATGLEVTVGRSEKMSKSKKNIVDPEKIINKYGADAVRFFIVSDTPPEKDFDWSDEGLEGCWRFMNRVWRLCMLAKSKGVGADSIKNFSGDVSKDEVEIFKIYNKTIKNVEASIESHNMNKSVAFIREFINNLYANMSVLEKNISLYSVIMRDLIKIMSPFTPHISEEIWKRFGFKNMVSDSLWPSYDARYVEDKEISIAVQVNGKLRGTININIDATEDKAFLEALKIQNVSNFIGQKPIRKKIYVKGKIVNLVI